jgi:hypothetical protein
MIIHAKIAKSKKRKISVKKQQEYDKWLKSLNIDTSSKKTKDKSVLDGKYLLSNYRQTAKIASTDVVVLGPLTKSGIMKDYYKLSEEDKQKVDDIAACTAPIHKSSYIYVSAGMNPASLGRKNEVL